ncbi:MAG: MATE family efflux transporter [Akkermansia sp.]
MSTISSTQSPSKRRFFDWQELKQSLVIMFPLYIAYLMNTGMSLIDTLVAGKAGETNLAGVAIGSSICWPVIISLGSVLTIIGPMISRYRGEGKGGNIGALLSQSKMLAVLIAALAILLLGALSRIFPYVSDDAETVRIATGYVFAMMWGVPATIMMRVFSGYFEGHHQTRPAMVMSVLGLLINFPLNWAFVFGWGPIPAMGGIGCGLATSIITWFISLGMLAIMMLARRHRQNAFHLIALRRPDWCVCQPVLRMGIPIGIAILCEMTFFCAIGLVIAPLGNTAMSAQQVAITISGSLFMLPMSLSVAASIRASFHIGAGQETKFRNLVSTLIITTTCLSLCVMTALYLLRYPILEQFTDSAPIIETAQLLLILCGVYQFPDALQALFAGLLRGCHDTKILSSVNICSYWVIGFPLSYSLIRTDWIVPAMGPSGAWVSFIVALSLTSILLGLRFYRTQCKIFPKH